MSPPSSVDGSPLREHRKVPLGLEFSGSALANLSRPPDAITAHTRSHASNLQQQQKKRTACRGSSLKSVLYVTVIRGGPWQARNC